MERQYSQNASAMSIRFSHITLPSPAKLNLMLHILGQRQDGYHNLQTLIQFVDFSDEMTFTSRADDKIKLLTPLRDVDDRDNLILRAAALLRRETGTEFGASINITKRIPIGGGMGGGSSNAATTLVGLNQIWRTKLSQEELQKLGGTLGADVPIFIHGFSAWAEGIGDVFTAVEIPERWFVVVTPPLRIITAEIFSHKDLTRNTPPTSPAEILQKGGHNDCQSLLLKLYPELHRPFDWLGKFAPAQITGTGSSIFAAFSSRAEAETVVQQLPNDITGFISPGLNLSPLYGTGKITHFL